MFRIRGWAVPKLRNFHSTSTEDGVPEAFINARGNDLTEAMVEYLKPLIQGEMPIVYENGLPVYLPVEHLVSR